MTRTSDAGTVLIGFAESFAAIEAAWSLQRAGFRVSAFARKGSHPALRFARGIQIHKVTPPETDVVGWQLDVESLVASLRPHAFLPLDDSTLWLSNRMSLRDCRLAGPTAGGAEVALNKEAQIERAAASGIAVPPTTAVDSIREVTFDAGPVIVKPADAVRVEGGRMVRPTGVIIANATELAAADSNLGGGRLLVQPVITGRGEGLFGSIGSAVEAPWSAHRRIRMVNPSGSASSACESVDVDVDLQRQVRCMLQELDWRGLFMVEFLRDTEGQLWFMELNGRAWGSLALATARGFEYPAWAVQDALRLPLTPAAPISPPYVCSRHIGREVVHLAFVLRGPRSTGVAAWPPRGATVRNLLTVRRHDRAYNWNRTQIDVLAADTWRTVADQFSRALRKSA